MTAKTHGEKRSSRRVLASVWTPALGRRRRRLTASEFAFDLGSGERHDSGELLTSTAIVLECGPWELAGRVIEPPRTFGAARVLEESLRLGPLREADLTRLCTSTGEAELAGRLVEVGLSLRGSPPRVADVARSPVAPRGSRAATCLLVARADELVALCPSTGSERPEPRYRSAFGRLRFARRTLVGSDPSRLVIGTERALVELGSNSAHAWSLEIAEASGWGFHAAIPFAGGWLTTHRRLGTHFAEPGSSRLVPVRDPRFRRGDKHRGIVQGPDGRAYFACERVLYSIDDALRVESEVRFDGDVTAIAAGPQTIAIGSDDGRITQWDPTTGCTVETHVRFGIPHQIVIVEERSGGSNHERFRVVDGGTKVHEISTDARSVVMTDLAGFVSVSASHRATAALVRGRRRILVRALESSGRVRDHTLELSRTTPFVSIDAPCVPSLGEVEA